MGSKPVLKGLLSCDWLTEKGSAGRKADHGLGEGCGRVNAKDQGERGYLGKKK